MKSGSCEAVGGASKVGSYAVSHARVANPSLSFYFSYGYYWIMHYTRYPKVGSYAVFRKRFRSNLSIWHFKMSEGILNLV